VIDIAAESKKSLECIGYVRFDLLRRHAGIKCSHHHDRNVDLREQIDGHARHRRNAYNRHNQADHDDEVGIGEGKLGHLLGSWSPGLPEFNFFRRDLHTGAKFVAAADHNTLAVGKSGKDFNVGAALQAQAYLAFFEDIWRINN
jgi:hypothetical protein